MNTGKALHESALPRPVLAHHRYDLPGTEGRAYSLKGAHPPEALTYRASLQEWLGVRVCGHLLLGGLAREFIEQTVTALDRVQLVDLAYIEHDLSSVWHGLLDQLAKLAPGLVVLRTQEKEAL